MLGRLFGYLGQLLGGQREIKQEQGQGLLEAEEEQKRLQEQLTTVEKQYESFRSKAAIMKSEYEEKISNLEAQQEAPLGDQQLMMSKVKQIMSSVYHDLKGQFDEDSSYKGQEVNNNIMDTIKRVTLSMMQGEDDSTVKAKEVSDTHGAGATAQEVMRAVSAATTGSHGNPYYAAELQQTAEEPMVAASQYSTNASAKSHKDKPIQEACERVISAVVAPSTGDRGNPYYAKELNKVKQEKHKPSEKSADSDILSGVLSAMVAPSTGDKGNPYYAAELDQTNKVKEGSVQNLEESIEAAIVSSNTASKPHQPQDTHKTAPPSDILEGVMSAMVAPSTGDRGNPHYAAELNAADKKKKKKKDVSGPEIVADVIKAAVAHTTGDKGNPYYTTQLNKHQKHQDSPEEPLVASSVSSNTTAIPAKHNKPSPSEKVISEVISAAVAPSTGDKGNPYYAIELNKHKTDKARVGDAMVDTANTNAAKSTIIEDIIAEVIQPSVAPSTGDRGNPHYAAELSNQAKGEKAAKKENLFTEKSDLSEGEPIDLHQKVTALQHLVSQHEDESGETDQITVTMLPQEGAEDVHVDLISPVMSPTTGYKGNPLRAEEIRKRSQEGSTGVAVVEKVVMSQSAAKAGDEPEIKIACVESPTTGGWGNPLRAEEILRKGPEA